MNLLRQHVLRWVRPLHRKFRGRKLELFFELLNGHPSPTLLDVGGGTGIDREFLPVYERARRITLVNLESVQLDASLAESVYMVIADGCCLPFPSGSFEWVFCNAVIEHVGDGHRQQQFANEIRRVAARGYFVATPNRHFPIEPHTLMPFYQFLPSRVQQRVVRFSPGYLRSYEEINLLSANELKDLFPEATVMKIGLPIFPNNLVAFYRAS